MSTTRRDVRWIGLALITIVGLMACGAPRTVPSGVPRSAPAASEEQPRLPFGVTVSQELNDGKRLFVKAAIDAHARWSTAELVVLLTGYRNGEKVGEQVTPLTVLGPVLEQGSQHELPMVLNAPNITDYQLELLWGRDSHTVRGAKAANGLGRVEAGLEIRNVSVRSERVNCGVKGGCDLQFAITAELRNVSDRTLTGAVLGTGFIWVDSPALDLSERIPENEATVELSRLDLGPGASRKVRLVLDRTVPERSDGAFEPVLRVISSAP
ncbi:MAG: hypothetical protein EBZ48_14580 [Proteobacteria bacterium]|nr:hypothetical protein [Pseudomonadota bacterium]